jgi:hypothetical protein
MAAWSSGRTCDPNIEGLIPVMDHLTCDLALGQVTLLQLHRPVNET